MGKRKTGSDIVKKQKGTRILSNLKINVKVIIIFSAMMVSLTIMFVGMMMTFFSLRNENNAEKEKTAALSAQQYVSTAVENMLSAAKMLYTNDDIYDFLNKKYPTTIDYYNAYYEFSKNAVLGVAKGSSVKQLRIYTANDTVLNGGNIGRFDMIEDEAWFKKFASLNRDMIIYCDNGSKQISLIRKLDYHPVYAGESLIKLDFNMTKFQEAFKNMYFDGSVCMVSDGVLLCSNLKDINSKFFKGTHISKNYYTCELDFYVSGKVKGMENVMFNSKLIPLAILFATCLTIVTIIIIDIKNRIKEVCDICTGSGNAPKIYFGKDEIGKLYNDVKNTLLDVNRLSDEKRNLQKYISDYREKTNEIILRSLELDTMMRFGLDSNVLLNEPIPLSEEILNIKRSLDMIKEKEDFKYDLVSDMETTEKNIIPYSLSAAALHIAEYSLKKGDHLEIDLKEHDECYSVRFIKKNACMTAAELLRLRAIFELDGENSFPSFTAGDEFNPYIRLSRFCRENISIKINSKEFIDFELVIKNKVLLDPPEQETL